MTATGQPLPLSATALAHDAWLSRFRTILVAILGCAVSGIGCLAFYTSFEAIKSYAERSSGIAPEHAWAVPLLVDSFIVVATGADLWFTTAKAQRRLWEIWWPKVLLAGAAGVSFILNVAHAQSGSWPARGVAAIPPAALVLGVELLMMVLRRATALRFARLQAELDKQQLELAALQAPPPAVRGEITRKQRQKRREMSSPASEVVADDDEEAAERDPNLSIFTPTTTPARDDRRQASRGAAPRAAAPPAKPAAKPAVQQAAAANGEVVFDPAKLRADKRPSALGKDGKPLTPYVVAARILDELDEKDSLTPEGLVRALAGEGLNVDAATAGGLLRELRPPLANRMPSGNGRPVAGMAAKSKHTAG